MKEAQKRHSIKEQSILPWGCPGNLSQIINIIRESDISTYEKTNPQLRNWPIQINLIPLKASYYENAVLLIAADCCAYAYAGFHNDFIIS